MNVGYKKGIFLANKFLKKLKKSTRKDFIILPSTQSIQCIKLKLNNKFLNLGAQDCSQFAVGAFTGDISASMIKEIGCKYVLIGHSERRVYYNESNSVLKSKIKNAYINNLKVIFCIGENLDDYKNGKTKSVLNYQLSNVFNKNYNFKNLVIAYEPVWAIGTNNIPSLEEIEKAHEYIKGLFYKKFQVENICVIYGGSVNSKNSKEIFSISNVDGGLIGGASLKADDFKIIYDNL
jgi:triosephosphate isomerase